MNVTITYGQDTPAYATVKLDVPDDATDETIIDMAKAKADEVGDLVFEPSYDWTGLRIVDITLDNGECVANSIPLEPSGEDLGLECSLWLRKRSSFAALRAEAERQGILAAPSEENPMRELQAEYCFREDKDPKIVQFMAPADASQDEITMLAHQALVNLTSEHRIVPAQPRDELAFAPFKMVIETFAVDEDDEYGEPPSAAMIEIDAAFVQRIQRLSALCAHNNLQAVTASEVVRWDRDDLHRHGDAMTVFPDGGFYFRAHPKHADYEVETRAITTDAILAAIARRDDAAQDGQCLRWIHGVLFYAQDPIYVQGMADDWLDANPGDWVIFHPKEYDAGDRAGFWNNDDGWTTLEGATRFHTMPKAPYPIGGGGGQAAALCIGTMQDYTVTLRDTEDDGSVRLAFQCFAEDADHAVEQANDAYPGMPVHRVSLSGQEHCND